MLKSRLGNKGVIYPESAINARVARSIFHPFGSPTYHQLATWLVGWRRLSGGFVSMRVFILFLSMGLISPIFAGENNSKNNNDASEFKATNIGGKFASAGIFQQLINELSSLGREGQDSGSAYRGKLRDLLGFSEREMHEERKKGVIASPNRSADYLSHEVMLVLDVSATPARNVAVVMSTAYSIFGQAGEEYYFRLSTKGDLDRAIVIRGPNDANNKVISGAGKTTILDLNDPEVQYRFQHELNFWLKGMYRREKPQEPAKVRKDN